MAYQFLMDYLMPKFYSFVNVYHTNIFNLSIIICLHTVVWFQVFLSNTNNFQTDLFDPYMGSE